MANLSVIKIYPQTLPGYHGNKIWDQIGYNSASAKDICEIFASMGGFGDGLLNEANLIPPPLLPFECHMTPNSQDRDREISMARYLRNWSSVGKHYFTNKTVNINVQNISLYTC